MRKVNCLLSVISFFLGVPADQEGRGRNGGGGGGGVEGKREQSPVQEEVLLSKKY